MTRHRLRMFGLLAGVTGAGMFAAWLLWPRTAITRENAEKIHVGMTREEVETILGGPAREEFAQEPMGDFPGEALDGISLEQCDGLIRRGLIGPMGPPRPPGHRWLSESVLIDVRFDEEKRLFRF